MAVAFFHCNPAWTISGVRWAGSVMLYFSSCVVRGDFTTRATLEKVHAFDRSALLGALLSH